MMGVLKTQREYPVHKYRRWELALDLIALY